MREEVEVWCDGLEMGSQAVRPYLCKEMSDFKKKSSSGFLETCLINHSEQIKKKTSNTEPVLQKPPPPLPRNGQMHAI